MSDPPFSKQPAAAIDRHWCYDAVLRQNRHGNRRRQAILKSIPLRSMKKSKLRGQTDYGKIRSMRLKIAMQTNGGHNMPKADGQARSQPGKSRGSVPQLCLFGLRRINTWRTQRRRNQRHNQDFSPALDHSIGLYTSSCEKYSLAPSLATIYHADFKT